MSGLRNRRQERKMSNRELGDKITSLEGRVKELETKSHFHEATTEEENLERRITSLETQVKTWQHKLALMTEGKTE